MPIASVFMGSHQVPALGDTGCYSVVVSETVRAGEPVRVASQEDFTHWSPQYNNMT